MQNHKPTYPRVLLLAAGVLAAVGQHCSGGTVFWDNNGLSAPSSGTWDTTTPQWATTSALTAAPVVWDPTAAAVFPAGTAPLTALTISVNSPINFAGIFDGLTSSVGVTNLILGGSSSLNLNSGVQGFSTGNANWNTLIRIPITGTGGLQNQGSGSLWLSGNNTYTGGSSFGTGSGLNINNGNAFGTGPITVSVSSIVLATPATDSTTTAFATGPITIANSWQTFNGTGTEIMVGLAAAPITFTGPWTLPGAAGTTTTLDMRNTTITISGTISGGANLTKANASGILVLSGANTYTGKTVVSGGTLSVSYLSKVTGGSASSSLGAPTSEATGTIGIG